jgi:hypothetical protein
MGNTLTKLRMRGENTVYGSKEACRQCPNKCTSSTKHKRVSFGPTTKCVPVRIYGDAQILTQIPVNLPISPFNHTLHRKDYKKRKLSSE